MVKVRDSDFKNAFSRNFQFHRRDPNIAVRTVRSIIQPVSGEIRLRDGFHYKGDFFKNSLEGHGHITFPDDSEYEVAVVDGLRHWTAQ